MFDTAGRFSPQHYPIERITVDSGRSFDELVLALEHELGHFDPTLATALVEQGARWDDLASDLWQMAGRHGVLMLFRENAPAAHDPHVGARRCIFYLVGNPALPDHVVRNDVSIGLLVPFRLEVREKHGRATLSYDRFGSSLAALGTEALQAIGTSLDSAVGAFTRTLCARGGRGFHGG